MVVASLFSFWTGCATQPFMLNSVGPAPVRPAASKPMGYLRVYTATEAHEDGDNTYYYPHTSYRVYDASGKLCTYVPNHTSNEDEMPACIAIPVGDYTIKAASDLYSLVAMPVVIRAGLTTEIHLDSGWKPPAGVSTNEIVYLPNGEAVGWRSSAGN
jgi:hypothetical protein